uniref:Uncharacterized protein n=1 Tax=viral metagenome TaxID=1070528 RepID=A0A6M3XV93_9ZZZZ
MLEYQIPLWIALISLISLIIGGLAGLFAIATAGAKADLELELITEREKKELLEKKLKESYEVNLSLKKRNIELRELYMDLKDREFIKFKEGD